MKYNSNEAFIVATCDVMLVSPKVNVEPHEQRICLDAYCKDTPRWGLLQFMEWSQLKKGFIVDNSCKFKLTTKAMEYMTAEKDYWLKQGLKFDRMIEPEEGSDQKFRLTINEIQNSIGVCSPRINFNDTTWRIAASQINNKVVVTVCNTGNNSCKMTSKFELMPSDRSMQSVTKGKKNFNFNINGESYYAIELIDWKELIDPRKKFIRNETSFVIEVEFKAKHVKSVAKKRQANAKNSGGEMSASKKSRSNARDGSTVFSSCSLCFDELTGQPISSVKPCNHVFCTICVRGALRKKNKCPMCNGAVQSLISYATTE